MLLIIAYALLHSFAVFDSRFLVVSSGVDSFYEYLIKAHILFGKDEFWRMFQSAYLGVQKYFRHGPWYSTTDFPVTVSVLPPISYFNSEMLVYVYTFVCPFGCLCV